ncbi:MAG TPA: hypothetical protein VGV89_09300 [Thermoplasmata archaeon]|nr:hypothetical protein [Thermoplasmata archaeon]
MKTRVPLAVGQRLADRILGELRPLGALFSRVEVAGSVRRKKPEVGDVEIVAQAGRQYDVSAVHRVLERLYLDRGPPNSRNAKAPWGPKYYRGVAQVSSGIEVGVDLFVVTPPADWGDVFLIRTGDAEFSQAVVTRLHRYGLKSEEGRLIRASDHLHIQCPHERDVLRAARLPWIPPERRYGFGEFFHQVWRREWDPNEELGKLADLPDPVGVPNPAMGGR